MIRIENWGVVVSFDPYMAPEQFQGRLTGNVFGHPYFPDGTHVKTSPVIGKKGGKITTYSGTEYNLGKVDSLYEKKFPNARERVFDSLKELEGE